MAINTRKLVQLTKKLDESKERQARLRAEFTRKEKELRRAIETERLSYLARLIKQTGFPADKDAVLIGAILDAKARLSGEGSEAFVNHCIELYVAFTTTHPPAGADGAVDEEGVGNGM